MRERLTELSVIARFALILCNGAVPFIFTPVPFGQVRRPYMFKEVSPLMTCT